MSLFSLSVPRLAK
ncbi:putative 60S ribosomal protein L27, partial [Toxoplasma gondii VAND]